jgi:hypothetical protein
MRNLPFFLMEPEKTQVGILGFELEMKKLKIRV